MEAGKDDGGAIMPARRVLPALAAIMTLFVADVVCNAIAIAVPFDEAAIARLAYALLLSFPIILIGFFAISIASRRMVAQPHDPGSDRGAFVLTIAIIALLAFVIEALLFGQPDGLRAGLSHGARSALLAVSRCFVPALIVNFVKPSTA